MTKEQAEQIKKAIKKSALPFKPYFKKADGKLRIQFYEHSGLESTDNNEANRKMVELLNVVASSGVRPRFKIEQIIYQGFIDCRYLVFE